MRVNIYAEEMTDRLEIVTKETDDGTFTGLRFYLELPVTIGQTEDGEPINRSGPFIHRANIDENNDDDSAAVTFWGKRDLRQLLRKALDMLDDHYAPIDAAAEELEREIVE